MNEVPVHSSKLYMHCLCKISTASWHLWSSPNYTLGMTGHHQLFLQLHKVLFNNFCSPRPWPLAPLGRQTKIVGSFHSKAKLHSLSWKQTIHVLHSLISFLLPPKIQAKLWSPEHLCPFTSPSVSLCRENWGQNLAWSPGINWDFCDNSQEKLIQLSLQMSVGECRAPNSLYTLYAAFLFFSSRTWWSATFLPSNQFTFQLMTHSIPKNKRHYLLQNPRSIVCCLDQDVYFLIMLWKDGFLAVASQKMGQ